MPADIMICLPILDGDVLPLIPDEYPDYTTCLKMAGAEVLAYKQFGSYQGDWWALVKIGEVTGWVNGSFGSCDGCDAFQSEFDWDSKEKPDYAHRLAAFGRGYLDSIYSQEAAEKEAARNIEWDHDARKMFDWIKSFRQRALIEEPK